HRQGRADGVADQYLAGGEAVRPADRRHRPVDQLDRRLGGAIDAEPRQAHQIRGARWPILRTSTSSSWALLLPYSAGNAWISMVLVTADFRRRGIATKLVDACLGVATRRGLTTWMDATPAGV